MTSPPLALLATLVGLTATVGCGNDVTQNDPQRPIVIEAAAGRGGAAGEANTAEPTAGPGGAEGGASGAPSDALLGDALGSACHDPQDCPSELTCLTDTSYALASGSPPGGVCTFDCDEAPLDCAALNGRCVAFANRSFCMQRCAFGNGAKCHGRDDFACEPTYRRVDVHCDVDTDCGSSAVCRSGACHIVYPLCLPRCNADSDCPYPAACDPVSGECIDEAPGGKPLGATCDHSAARDECRGVCLGSTTDDAGRCHEFCTLGATNACGPDADCILTLDSAPGSASGDIGGCATRCTCETPCEHGLECVSLDASAGAAAGYCSQPNAEQPVLDCIDGTGGAPANP